MIDVSPTQLVACWEQLFACKHDMNHYGGVVAEIYMYTLMPYLPSVAATDRTSRDAQAAYAKANRALFDICKMFEEHHDVTITCEGDEPLDLLIETPQAPFTHRVHLKVTRR